MTLTNFAQAEVTGKAVPPTSGTCPAVNLRAGPPGSPAIALPNGYAVRDISGGTLGVTVVCVTEQSEFDGVGSVTDGISYTLTTSNQFFVVGRLTVQSSTPGGSDTLHNGIISTGLVIRETSVSVLVSVSVRTETSVSVSVRTETSVSVSSVTVRVASDGTPIGTVVQTRKKVDNKRALQYAAGGVAAFVLIHNWIITDPAKALPFHLAFNEKGGIYSGTSWRLTPQETLHFSALESLDDKRGHYKFGVQWHYQIPPPQGITETPQAALPAIYTMPNVKPKDWLNE